MVLMCHSLTYYPTMTIAQTPTYSTYALSAEKIAALRPTSRVWRANISFELSLSSTISNETAKR